MRDILNFITCEIAMTEATTLTTELIIPEGIQKARTAFLQDFPKLMANRSTRGNYVCYHHDKLVAVAKDFQSLLNEVIRKNVPEDESLMLRVQPSADREMQEVIDEIEINP